ncbi:IS3 family transposase [Gilliamella sp. GillExp13]|uniref:IS3 family transposase n=1 Tax=Gilliamella sp. GillExp13 TaxID=3120243 RepID=UPI00080DB1F2|nr:IS3 family transposase [Gilliamella apicola]OCG59543.1 hypothetical protein A9G37_05115 [Gilliamella apicola]
MGTATTTKSFCYYSYELRYRWLKPCAYYYQPKLQDDSVIVSVLNAITDRHLRWGFPKCFNRIRKLGYQWNHKRVYRVYCELKLNLRVKRKKRIPPRCPEKLFVPNKQGECCSMDFMSDSSRNQDIQCHR